MAAGRARGSVIAAFTAASVVAISGIGLTAYVGSTAGVDQFGNGIGLPWTFAGLLIATPAAGLSLLLIVAGLTLNGTWTNARTRLTLLSMGVAAAVLGPAAVLLTRDEWFTAR
jgi:hypothetical protein